MSFNHRVIPRNTTWPGDLSFNSSLMSQIGLEINRVRCYANLLIENITILGEDVDGFKIHHV